MIESYPADAGPRSLAALDPSGRTLIAGQQDGSITAFDLGGGRRLGRTFSWNTPDQACGYTPCMALNRQSALMASDQGDGTVAIVDLRTLRLVRTLPARDGGTSAAIDSSHNRVEVVQIATGKLLQSHTVPHGPNGVEFSRDGRALLALGCCWTGAGSTLLAWDARTGRQLFSLGDRVAPQAFDVSPDSRLLGVGTAGGKVLLLDGRSGRRVAPPIQAAAGDIAQVSFSPDGHAVAVSSDDHTATVWDLRTRSRLGNVFGPYAGTVPAALFAPDGRLVIDLLSSAIEWPMDARTWRPFACRVAGRNLTRTEWHDLLPNRPFQRVCRGNG